MLLLMVEHILVWFERNALSGDSGHSILLAGYDCLAFTELIHVLMLVWLLLLILIICNVLQRILLLEEL